jgi:hypothetical protein
VRYFSTGNIEREPLDINYLHNQAQNTNAKLITIDLPPAPSLLYTKQPPYFPTSPSSQFLGPLSFLRRKTRRRSPIRLRPHNMLYPRIRLTPPRLLELTRRLEHLGRRTPIIRAAPQPPKARRRLLVFLAAIRLIVCRGYGREAVDFDHWGSVLGLERGLVCVGLCC